MQIEFYLPLPSEGFWAAMIIYYMVGLFYCLHNSLINYDRHVHARAFNNTPDIAECLFLAIIASLWPYDLLMSYRNQ